MDFRDNTPVYSEQLWLWPDEPWNGQSPRVLTAARNPLFLRQEPPRHEVDPDPLQLEIWPLPVKATLKKKAAPKQGAASLLLPLKAGRKSRSRALRLPRGD